MTTWVHWSSRPIVQVDGRRIPDQPTSSTKPEGLWISDESDLGWKEWCNTNEYSHGPDAFAYRNDVTFVADANLLCLETPDAVRGLIDRYPEPPKHWGTFRYRYINWAAVAEDYQGVLITPYQWDCRRLDVTSWYFTWDCSSGCIWDYSAISSIRTAASEVTA